MHDYVMLRKPRQTNFKVSSIFLFTTCIMENNSNNNINNNNYIDRNNTADSIDLQPQSVLIPYNPTDEGCTITSTSPNEISNQQQPAPVVDSNDFPDASLTPKAFAAISPSSYHENYLLRISLQSIRSIPGNNKCFDCLVQV